MAIRQRRIRGTRDAEGAKAAILAAAVGEFTAKGLAGARMDEIARRAEVAKGLVFHHFGSKEGLWTAALEHIYALLRAGQDETALDALGPVEGMRRLAHDTFRLFRAHPEIVALMNEENLHRARHLRAAKAVPGLYNPLFATIERLLAAGRARGLFREDVDVTALYVAMSGLGYFYCANRWTLSAAFAGDLFQSERIDAYEAMLGEMVVAYLRKPASPPGTARGA
ncbi:TetR/AcrR family transcriptional regulator [Sediminicoccus sp. KRV36]|uniref:TetR/AcrR family transcriptional regulator n=1 Tax=Sediminicoccus sp. KRV36 TaxID=3133721 RepID=UPI00200D41EB|nr:TetR/AcrR family transcriptional regulator [Sediminicoccus rosea]UPY38740.1 TetR family transcriptional regulator [Sediminicoccus rosea]